MKEEDLQKLLQQQRTFFATGATQRLSLRRWALQKLQAGIRALESQLLDALRLDLGKDPCEGYMTEIGMVLGEIRYQLKYLERFAAPRRVPTPLAQFPGRSLRIPQPYGNVLVISPWNYPVMLSLEPLVDALAAGNTVLLKPSDASPHTSLVLQKLIGMCFPQKYVAVVTGGRAENQQLLDQKFDYIFFTGGKTVGRVVLEKAAKHLTPVTLELGGKSPCIVDATANLDVAARRIVFGKFLNGGQTCVAPDYLLVQEEVKEPLLRHMARWIRRFYGADPLNNPQYGRIVNQKHYDRLMGLIQGEQVFLGGLGNGRDRIAPTILTGVSPKSPIMQEEIFGPILPVLTFSHLEQAIAFVNRRPKPLALYLFTESPAAKRRVLSACSFGGGCVNDTIIHLASSHLPFGGVGESGMGAYHGRAGFDTFTHWRSVVDKGTWLDLPLRYPPYTKVGQALLRLFLQ